MSDDTMTSDKCLGMLLQSLKRTEHALQQCISRMAQGGYTVLDAEDAGFFARDAIFKAEDFLKEEEEGAKMDAKCCFDPCGELAEFEIGRIRPTANPEGGEVTHACSVHVGALLGYTTEPHEGGWWVVPL